MLFNLFAATELSENVCVAKGTLCNDSDVCIVTTVLNCGCEFRPRKFWSASVEPPASGVRRKSSWGDHSVAYGGHLYLACAVCDVTT